MSADNKSESYKTRPKINSPSEVVCVFMFKTVTRSNFLTKYIDKTFALTNASTSIYAAVSGNCLFLSLSLSLFFFLLLLLTFATVMFCNCNEYLNKKIMTDKKKTKTVE